MILQAQPMRRAGADPYSRWLAYVNAITAQDIADPNTGRALSVGWGVKRFTFPETPGGTMYGTPYGPVGLGAFTDDSHFTRIAQHSFLDNGARLANHGRVVLLHVKDWGGSVTNFASYSLNGYTSIPYEPEYAAGWCDRFEYFNPTTGRRVLRNPYNNTWQESDL